MSVAEKLLTIAENSRDMYSLAESKKGMIRGNIIKADNVSGYEHSLDVKLSSKNLIPYPYYHTTRTENGITFTDNGDGSITVDGTSTGAAFFHLNTITVKPGTYFLSGATVNATIYTQVDKSYYDTGKGISFNVTTEQSIIIRIFAPANRTVDNAVIKPQLELGTVATPYTPYITNFSGIEVIRYGKNIAPCINNPTTVQDITFTPNADGSVTVNGTSTGYAMVDLINPLNLAPNVNYRLSGNSANCIVYISYYSNGTIQWFRPENYTFTWKDTYTNAQLYLQVSSGKTLDNEIVYPQLEVGNTVTDFEPYKAPQTATANDGGTVNGLTSLSPNITLIPNNDGVSVECTYYTNERDPILNAAQDIKTALTELKENL